MAVKVGPWGDKRPSRDDNDGNGTGGGGNDMEIRIARLESDVEYIKRDIAEIRQDAKDFRAEVRESFNLLHADIGSVRAELSSKTEGLRADIKVLWGGLFAVALGLAGLLAKGFHWI